MPKCAKGNSNWIVSEMETSKPKVKINSSASVPFGLKDGVMYEPLQVVLGQHCGCVCPGCSRPLMAKHCLKSDTIAHFAHMPGDDCSYGRETSIHLAAKQLIEQYKKIHLPSLIAEAVLQDINGFEHKALKTLAQSGLKTFNAVRLEQKVSDFRPDLIAVNEDGSELLIEIAVTHFVDVEKQAKIDKCGIALIEIDCKSVPLNDFDQLKTLLFEPSTNVKWLYHPDVLGECLELERSLQPYLDEAIAQQEKYRLEEENERRLAREKLERKKAKIAEFKAMSEQEKLSKSLKYMGLSENNIPNFLNFKSKVGYSFDVASTVWQSSLFAAFMEGSREHNRNIIGFNVMRKWMDSHYTVTSQHYSHSVYALKEFLNYLVQISILYKSDIDTFVVYQDRALKVVEVEPLVVKPVSFVYKNTYEVKVRSEYRYLWLNLWPERVAVELIARRYAKYYEESADWLQLAKITTEIRDNSPQWVANEYSIQTESAKNEVLEFLVEAGFVEREFS